MERLLTAVVWIALSRNVNQEIVLFLKIYHILQKFHVLNYISTYIYRHT